jgi:hypothetical protein
MIIDHGVVTINSNIIDYANSIKFENYKVNTPAKFQINSANKTICGDLMQQIGYLTGKSFDLLDFVFFSVCNGAEPHTDLLDPAVFEDTTYVIPVILPTGTSIITAEDVYVATQPGHVYEFDHTKLHSMVLEDTSSGCVVIMVAVKRQ